jgi:succinoglycan biosynthesis protein ExoV
MNVIYYKDKKGNFGDDLNEWIWHEIAPFIHKKKSEYSLLGIGSIINEELIKDKKVVIFGSGIGYGIPPRKEDVEIKSLRGKLSAKILGVDESFAIADSAILLNLISEFSPIPEEERNGIIFIPHHKTIENHDFSEICKNCGVELIDPTQDSKYVINKIRQAKLVIAEAMHAAIIADTMRVNWVPVVANHEINTFKWLDWLSTFNIAYNPIYIGVPDLIKSEQNNLLIKYNMAMYKPKYHNMNEKELLQLNKRHITYRLHRSCLKIKQKFITPKSNERHRNKIATLLKNISQSKGYLSSDEIFYKNLNLLQTKLNELKEFQ